MYFCRKLVSKEKSQHEMVENNNQFILNNFQYNN